ncbi:MULTISPECIES: NUDIX hydrolase [Cryobacterium]|uniref:CoA pyrophosphatase n=1 Tax=Cryobacterium zongtaii TaxID=1259217 RepID=A0A2S3ZD77_9MICO|nr:MULTISPECIES: CoA pyrophosphatase [Cryobacterium]ASD21789.1 coenzyme A pyrophosphatase [Cryobacterium sp. LW097]POH64324.1 CoA pyrophosphatase [Cryobacterium zongtaii]POH67879.1 CoA pyrophosphatase [Cryobacterium zongtaii]TFC47882.1 CoA pyrophosphatase [Cryobacterium sp. TMN-39-2]TFC52279.1 CoA pyrophosphatase [Cryobacterium sp. TMB3-1-2]
MLVISNDPRAELAALCERGLDWGTGRSRDLPDLGSARRAAVLVLFGVLDAVPAQAPAGTDRVPRDLDVLLLRRASTLGSHPGQIAFPGGRLEASDAGPIAAALREAVEETGLDAAGLEPLGTLPAMPVPVSNHLVTPVPAWWTRPSQVAAMDHAETVDVFRVPVADLLDPANRANTEHTVGDAVYRAPAFTVGDRLVWGFTAIVLSRMFDELGWADPWDHDRIVLPGR